MSIKLTAGVAVAVLATLAVYLRVELAVRASLDLVNLLPP